MTYVWLYPEKHENARGRHIHLTTARLGGEDPDLKQQAHVFEEWPVEVPVSDEHPDGLSVTHHMQAACGLTRSSWMHPILATGSHLRCPACEEKIRTPGIRG